MYFDTQGNIDPRWVNTEALTAARSFIERRQDKIDAANSIKASQLRKFYGEVKRLELVWRTGGSTPEVFQRLLPQLKLLKAKVAYARNRKVVPLKFELWLSKHVDSVNTQEAFGAFLLHFEAVVGFAYGEGLKD